MYRLAYIITVILVSLITSLRCDEIVTFMEGDEALLVFPFPCTSTKITLQYGDRYPFFDSTNPGVLSLPPDPQGRFTVANTTKGSRCLLHLNIVPVTRDDAGTYILLANNNAYITRVGLDVDFLPGKARCELSGRHTAQDWVKLHCIAPIGSMEGKIQCYQNGMEMPPLSEPLEESLKTLEQTILVQDNSHLVFCCSSERLKIEPKGRCHCNDFVWNPLLSQEEVNATEGPCPFTTSAQAGANTSQSPNDQTRELLILPKTTDNFNMTNEHDEKSDKKYAESKYFALISKTGPIHENVLGLILHFIIPIIATPLFVFYMIWRVLLDRQQKCASSRINKLNQG